MLSGSFLGKFSKRYREIFIFTFCLFPFLSLSVLFIVWPFLQAVIVSFWGDYNMLFEQGFTFSLQHYIRLFSDKWFYQAVRNTVMYTCWTTLFTMGLSMLISILLYYMKRMQYLILIALFLPLITSASAIGYTWRYMFHERVGLFNYLLSFLHVVPIKWLSNGSMTIITLIIFGVWRSLPLSIYLLYVGLSNIDPHLIEAATIDGANTRQCVLHIIIPLWRNVVLVVSLINSINFLKVFDELFYLFQGKPGPFYNMYTMIYYIYENMRSPVTTSIASAASVVFVAPVVALGVLQAHKMKVGE